MKLEEFTGGYIQGLEETLRDIPLEQIAELGSILYEAYREGRQIFVLGNGGSAAAASHWVCDFNKGINTPNSRRAKFVSLADNTGIVTALGNDISYDEIFAYQLENFAGPGDVVLALSVSGNSPNLLRGLECGKKLGCKTAAIVGDYGGKAGEQADFTLTIPSRNYGIVEDIHLILNHVISQYFLEKNKQEEKNAS